MRLKDPGRIADDLLARFQLTDAATRRVATYLEMTAPGHRHEPHRASTGDLPGRADHGLDPQGRLEVWQTVKELATQGTTVLLTTQYLEEAERLADRIAILQEGRIIVNGTLAEPSGCSCRPRSSTWRSSPPWRRSSWPSSGPPAPTATPTPTRRPRHRPGRTSHEHALFR